MSSESSLVEVKTQALEGKLKRISTLCVEASGDHLLLGTEGGNIYLLKLDTFTMAENIIYQDVVMQKCVFITTKNIYKDANSILFL